VVVTYHSDIIRQEFLLGFYRPFLRSFLSRTRVIMPTSMAYARSSPYLAEFLDKCEIVPLGIDTRLFDSVAEKMQSEIEKIRGVFGPEFLLFVGKLRYYKGLQFLIEAMRGIETPLVIIGSGPMENDLKALAANYDVTDKVRFVGEVTESDLAVFYHACSMLVLPSVYRSEAYGLVQIEAHACGKPVVSTRLGTGVEFVNMDGKTGLVVSPASSAALMKAINELMADPERRSRMGEFARQRARTEFDLEHMFAKVEAVYERALAGRP
jgi:rhamnosyl/mannosyltransferase